MWIVSMQRLRVGLLLPALALSVGACSAEKWEKADRWLEKQWTVGERTYPPERLKIGVRRAETAEHIAFAPGAAVLSPEQRDALVRFIARSGAGTGDDALVSISAAGGRALAERRAASIASFLHRQGLRVTRSFEPHPLPHGATVTLSRLVATAPNCPEWDRLMRTNTLEEHKPRFGCINAASLAASVHRPMDLVSGRPTGPSDGPTLDSGLQKLREGKLDAKPESEGSGTKSSGTATK
jgi:pilus biogenesis lipoprotein CpaD